MADYELATLDAVARACQGERGKPGGRRIGLINGCFELLHPGHVLMIQEAAGHCDRLVVAVDDDEQVCRLKGLGRPVRTLIERCFILTKLRNVAAVVRTGEDQPLGAALQAIRPDVYMYRAGAPEAEIRAAQDVGAETLELQRHGRWSSTTEIMRCRSPRNPSPNP